jgi:hypothetical protein
VRPEPRIFTSLQGPFVIVVAIAITIPLAIAIKPAVAFHEHRQHNTYPLTVRHYRRMNPSP